MLVKAPKVVTVDSLRLYLYIVLHHYMSKGLRPIVIIDDAEEYQENGTTLQELQDFYGSCYLLDEDKIAHRKDFILEDGKKYNLIKKKIRASTTTGKYHHLVLTGKQYLTNLYRHCCSSYY